MAHAGSSRSPWKFPPFQGLQQFQGKFWLRGNLAAGECYAAAGIPVVSPVLQDLLHHFLNGHLLSGHDESTGEAVRGAGSAVLAGGAIVLQGTVLPRVLAPALQASTQAPQPMHLSG